MAPRVLALMAHPDDAEICMGGTLARLAAAGREVHVLLCSLPDSPEQRRTEARAGAEILGFELHWLEREGVWQVEDLPTYALVTHFDRLISDLEPGLVFSHWPGDTHRDHVRVARAALSAVRRRRLELLLCEPPNLVVPTAEAFLPNTFVDVTATLEQGIEAAEAHRSQDVTRGFAEQIRARARYHGHRIGVPYAEAFESVWRVLDWPYEGSGEG